MRSAWPAGGDWVVASQSDLLASTEVVFVHVSPYDRLSWVEGPDDATAFLTQADAAAMVRRIRTLPERARRPGRPRLLVRRLDQAHELRRLTDASNASTFRQALTR